MISISSRGSGFLLDPEGVGSSLRMGKLFTSFAYTVYSKNSIFSFTIFQNFFDVFGHFIQPLGVTFNFAPFWLKTIK